jgi:tripeptide aminopeptidase
MGLSKQISRELKAIGMQDVTIDDKSYIMATLPSNVDHKCLPSVCSHFDTSPDFTGANVKPQIIPNYDGKDITNAEKTLYFQATSKIYCFTKGRLYYY